ncbi:amino acid racemase [Flavitalea sp. BT771]|uniref:aspartate/glutamate racemase family protein n=1 Tax=Flavitalea sp. BT771 TaxID=3063329 RepID=UPI0026E1B7B6|nr:amino acid racemase [Flavitalea sp. BT771]MDO6434616.1 amino acid racemase [Flavitalea sp. BT771]MDV6223516.1 amino acid racemase [Flavitalea sp. BT771]
MQPKKKLGIVGGMGSRAGVALVQKIIDYSPAETDQEFPEIIFHNNAPAPDRTRAIIYHEASPLPALLHSMDLFNRNQVDLVAVACITSYYYYEELAGYAKAKVLNPLQMVAEYLKKQYGKGCRAGLLATTGTLRTGLFQKYLEGSNVDLVTLSSENQEALFMRSVYMQNGFKSATISAEAHHLMDRSVRTLLKDNIDVVIGGCTEVSIAFHGQHLPVAYLDVLDLMAQRTVDLCYSTTSAAMPI